jgi:uncharacterized membrane protein HdeD (DUF308 family)
MLQTLARNWWAIALRGLGAIIFGLAALLRPGITLAALVLLYGAYALADGILAVAWSFVKRQPGAFPWSVFLAGLAGIAAGALTLIFPGLTALVLLYFIAAWAIVRGLSEIFAAIRLRKELEGEWLLALSGVLSVALGLLLVAAPGAGALALLQWIGAFAVVFGVVTVVLGFRLRRLRSPARPAA